MNDNQFSNIAKKYANLYLKAFKKTKEEMPDSLKGAWYKPWNRLTYRIQFRKKLKENYVLCKEQASLS